MIWIGVDFDGTLAEFHGDDSVLGAPVPAMVARVRAWLARDIAVRIVTARVGWDVPIQLWCLNHVGVPLPVTNSKDGYMVALYDDRAVAVERNTGLLLSPEPAGVLTP